jgi:hypothetical protein
MVEGRQKFCPGANVPRSGLSNYDTVYLERTVSRVRHRILGDWEVELKGKSSVLWSACGFRRFPPYSARVTEQGNAFEELPFYDLRHYHDEYKIHVSATIGEVGTLFLLLERLNLKKERQAVTLLRNQAS